MAEKKSKSAVQDKKSLNPTELKNELRSVLDKRAKLAFQHNVAPLKNPMELRHLRREIARIQTQLSVKEASK